jgi:hypothetical protein
VLHSGDVFEKTALFMKRSLSLLRRSEDLLSPRQRGVFHSVFPFAFATCYAAKTKKADVAKRPGGHSTTSAYSRTSLPANRAALDLVVRLLSLFSGAALIVVASLLTIAFYRIDSGTQSGFRVFESCWRLEAVSRKTGRVLRNRCFQKMNVRNGILVVFVPHNFLDFECSGGRPRRVSHRDSLTEAWNGRPVRFLEAHVIHEKMDRNHRKVAPVWGNVRYHYPANSYFSVGIPRGRLRPLGAVEGKKPTWLDTMR